MTRRLVCVLAIVLSSAPMKSQAPRFSTRTELVRVDVLVTDDRHPIGGLRAEDFELRDNGIPQRIDRVLTREDPIDAWLALDESGSVRYELNALVGAARAFAAGLERDDRSGLISFRHAVKLRSALGKDPSGLPSGLRLVRAEGYTSLRDAIFVALALRNESIERSLILIFSDGADTMSWLTDEQLLRAVADSDAVIYAVTGPEGTRVDAGDDRLTVSWRSRGDLLKALTDQTGGRLLKADGRSDLSATVQAILTEMKSRYVLTYYPAGVRREGWHPIEVRVKGRRAQVRARRGYYGS